MAFKGLFIGIDRYNSPSINWLNCAVKDAQAMHGLFTDTFGGESTLLIDEQATTHIIEKEFEKIANCNEDDFVVIYFSGHGTETQELVTFDASPLDYHSTAIPLELFTKWFTLISSKKVLCILDCCFSGGMGAKALQIDDQPKSASTEDSYLSQISGEGRIIFTASGVKEKSWESSKKGHGWMTYYLLEALIGANEVRQDGKISILQLLDYVTRRVIDETSRTGKKQNPTIRGTIDGEYKLPIFIPGPVYLTAFPEHSPAVVTSDLSSLKPYGFPEDLLQKWVQFVPNLNQLQLDAINQYNILKGDSLIVSSPTSSGKTMIGELAAIKGSLDRKRTFFLFPLKALVNDKLKYFNEVYGEYGVKTIRATGDTTTDEIKPLMKGQYDICLLTYEKFAYLVLTNPYILEQVGTIVIDEVQMIADKSRGVNLEFILTLLKDRKTDGIDPQIICLSAVIGDTNGLERWLNARLLKVITRPVPLDEGIIKWNGNYRFIDSSDQQVKEDVGHIIPNYGKGSSQDVIKPLVQKLVSEGKQVIVFRETTGEAAGTAHYLSEILNLPPADEVIASLPSGDPSVASTKLKDALKGGVAFHISHLDPDERTIVEEEFRKPNSKIRVIAATTTLAMGINTPTEAVIVAGLNHPDGPYSIAEYKNIIGRAGRLGKSSKGNSYLVTLNAHEENYYWNHYVNGQPEDITSKFFSDGTDSRSLILRILAAAQSNTGRGLSKSEIIKFIENSFGSFQERLSNPSWKWDVDRLEKAIDDLRSHELIQDGDLDTYVLTDLGRLSGESGVEVESVIRLVDTFSQTPSDSINDQSLLSATQLTVELDDLYFIIHPTSPKELQIWTHELRRQGVSQQIINSLLSHAKDTKQTSMRCKKAVATLLWVSDISMSQMETALTQLWGRFDGAAGQIRAAKSRVIDVLPTVARIVEIIHPDIDLSERLSKLLLRLEVGISPDMFDVANIAGSQLSRSDYLEFKSHGLTTVQALKDCTDDDLLACVNGNRAKFEIIRKFTKSLEEDSDIPHPIDLPLYQA